jgi:magnesium chelatase family protein
MHEQVIEAFARQKERQQPHLNGKLTEEGIERFCKLDNEAQKILDGAIHKFALSHRSIASIKKVARTIADLSTHDKIEKSDVLEALSYRRRK